MVKILKEILKKLPEEKISSVEFEGANIVIYTKDKEFLFSGREKIKEIVSELKKRIELRSDPSILKTIEETRNIIKEIYKDIKIGEIIFDTPRSKVIIEAENISEAVGENGFLLKEIQKKTYWSAVIRRLPLLRSSIVEGMRNVLFYEGEYRRRFLNNVGKRIYSGWTKNKVKEWVRFTMLGGGMQIGRSAILLQTEESRILIDCGIDPAVVDNPDLEYPYFEAPEFDLKELDAVVISHAHLDHCGLLPYLFKIGYKGPVYCTTPTRDIMALMQLDYLKVLNNTKRYSLYDANDIKEMIKHTITLNYGEVTDITPDIRLTLYNAGHILGSAMVHFNIGNGVHNFLYTGDFNYEPKLELLEPANTNYQRVESMLIESTNGGSNDFKSPREQDEEELLKVITDVYVKKGKILIPVFAVGRSQEIILTLNKLMEEERLPNIPVYIDGMVWEVTAIHTAYPEYLNRKLRNSINEGKVPFIRDNFKQVGSHKEREQIFESKDPCIVLATSGMMNGGSSVEYFKQFASDENNAIIFVGYQANGTLGRRLLDGEREILLSNEGKKTDKISVNLQLYKLSAFSGHADIRQIKRFLSRLTSKPRIVAVNHGERQKVINLANVSQRLLNCKTRTPENLESVRLN